MYVAENRKQFVRRQESPAAGPLICIAGREANFARTALERGGFAVCLLAKDADLISQLAELRPSALVIETSAVGSAVELCRSIRSVRSLASTPLLLLSARVSEEERVSGLEAGADDYIGESSTGREVVARVRALIRRFARHELLSEMPRTSSRLIHSQVGALTPAIRKGDIEIDPTAMRISVRGSEISATNLEFRLLYYLTHNEKRVFSRDQLLDAVWDTPHVELRSVDACVQRLRRKIESDPLRPLYLRTVRGAGYCLHAGLA